MSLWLPGYHTGILTRRPDEFELNTDSSLATGLRFAGLGRFTGSTRYQDSSLYGNHGTLQNMSPSSDWVFDAELGRYRLDFDGSDDSITVPHNANLNIGTDATSPLWVGGWFHPTRSNVNYETLVSKGESAGSYQWVIYWCGTGGVGVAAFYAAWFNTDNVPYYGCIGTAGRSVNSWYRVDACWHPGGNVQLYVNGVPDGSPNSGSGTAVTSNTQKMCIGRRNTVLPFQGRIADVCARRTKPDLQTLANRSDPMLGGLIQPIGPRWLPVAVAGEEPETSSSSSISTSSSSPSSQSSSSSISTSSSSPSSPSSQSSTSSSSSSSISTSSSSPSSQSSLSSQSSSSSSSISTSSSSPSSQSSQSSTSSSSSSSISTSSSSPSSPSSSSSISTSSSSPSSQSSQSSSSSISTSSPSSSSSISTSSSSQSETSSSSSISTSSSSPSSPSSQSSTSSSSSSSISTSSLSSSQSSSSESSSTLYRYGSASVASNSIYDSASVSSGSIYDLASVEE